MFRRSLSWAQIPLMALVAVAVGLVVVGCRQAPPATTTSAGTAQAAAGSATIAKTAAETTAAGPKTKLAVYIPCGIIIPAHAAIDAYQEAHPGVKVEGTYDNPLALERRIVQQGGGCDIYISSGPLEVQHLAQKGLVDTSTTTHFGQLELVLLVPKANPAHIKSVGDLVKASTIACPNPKLNSLGYVAKAALTKLGIWNKIKPKLVLTEFAIDTYKLAATGRADAAIAYKTCPLDSNPKKIKASSVRIACSFPADSYAPANAQFEATVATKCADPKIAESFISFLTSPSTGKLMAANGLPQGPTGGACPVTASTSPTSTTTQAGASAPKVEVVAYYPDTEGHESIKTLVLGLPKEFPGKVKAHFVDFTSDAGFKEWRAAGMSCGGIQINGHEAAEVPGPGGAQKHVTFAREMGINWTKQELLTAVSQAVKKAYGTATG